MDFKLSAVDSILKNELPKEQRAMAELKKNPALVAEAKVNLKGDFNRIFGEINNTDNDELSKAKLITRLVMMYEREVSFIDSAVSNEMPSVVAPRDVSNDVRTAQGIVRPSTVKTIGVQV